MYKIAISGRANTGKNTLSKMIVKELRTRARADARKNGHVPITLSVKYLAFADPIKEMVKIMFPDTPNTFLYGASEFRKQVISGAFKEGKPLTIRQLLQDLGTGVGRAYDDQIWLKNFDHRVSHAKSDIVIVTDVRFRNEFDHLKKQGFYQIRLYRNTGEPVMEHASETNQVSIADSEFDYVLHNDNPLKTLRKEVSENIIPQIRRS
jgi:hypothetical protein